MYFKGLLYYLGEILVYVSQTSFLTYAMYWQKIFFSGKGHDLKLRNYILFKWEWEWDWEVTKSTFYSEKIIDAKVLFNLAEKAWQKLIAGSSS